MAIKLYSNTVRQWYPAAVSAACAAGAFSLLVAALLGFNYLREESANPLNSRHLSDLKQFLEAAPQSEPLKERIRELDLELRQQYFQYQAFTVKGAYLLLGGVIVLLAALKFALDCKRTLPMPQAPGGAAEAQLQTASWARLSVAGLGGLFAGSLALLWAFSGPAPQLPSDDSAGPPALPPPALTGGTLLGTVGEKLSYQIVAANQAESFAVEPLPPGLVLDQRTGLISGTPSAVFGGYLKLSATNAAGTGRAELNVALVARVEKSSAPDPAPFAAYAPSAEELKLNWPSFRGPDGSGVSAFTNVPAKWDVKTGAGVLWKSDVPLPGENSAVVWDKRVFVTGATADERAVFCYDADTGNLLWTGQVDNVPGSPSEITEPMTETGYAAPTAVTNGQRVCAVFANGDLAAFDFDGRRAWAVNLGDPNNGYGFASSLAMYQNLVIVQFDTEASPPRTTLAEGGGGVRAAPHGKGVQSKLLAYDMSTGQLVWSTRRLSPKSWATPIVVSTPQGAQIITCANPWVNAYDPANGLELWRADCLVDDVAPSPVYANGLAFAVAPVTRLAAIKTSGRGDVSKTHVAWTVTDGIPDIASPVTNGELVFLLTTSGTLTCLEASSGKKVWEKDIEFADETRGEFKSSPSLVGNCLYLINASGTVIIVQAGREFKELARLEMGDKVDTCPAFTSGRMYIRGKQFLFGLGEKTP